MLIVNFNFGEQFRMAPLLESLTVTNENVERQTGWNVSGRCLNVID